MITIIEIIIVIVAFGAGILVGAHNQKKVSTIVTDVKTDAAAAQSLEKKL